MTVTTCSFLDFVWVRFGMSGRVIRIIVRCVTTTQLSIKECHRGILMSPSCGNKHTTLSKWWCAHQNEGGTCVTLRPSNIHSSLSLLLRSEIWTPPSKHFLLIIYSIGLTLNHPLSPEIWSFACNINEEHGWSKSALSIKIILKYSFKGNIHWALLATPRIQACRYQGVVGENPSFIVL